MRRQLILLATLVSLYLISSWILSEVYGPSYGFLTGEDSWVPDGQGGWTAHGQPAEAMPAEPSVFVPLWAMYLPILLPGLLLAAFLFTPLSRKLDPPKPTPAAPAEPEATDSESDPT